MNMIIPTSFARLVIPWITPISYEDLRGKLSFAATASEFSPNDSLYREPLLDEQDNRNIGNLVRSDCILIEVYMVIPPISLRLDAYAIAVCKLCQFSSVLGLLLW